MLKFNGQKMKDNSQFIFKMLKPWELLLNSILYFLGAGLTNYLGDGVNWEVIGKGFGLITAIQIGAYALEAVYQQIDLGYKFQRELFPMKAEDPRNIGRVRLIYALVISVIAMGVAILILSNLAKNQLINISCFIFLGLFLILYLANSLPPFKAAKKGYGELIIAVQGAYIIPTLAYLFQSGDLHRLILLTAVPLSLLYLTMEMTRSLKVFSNANSVTIAQGMVNRIGPERSLQVIIYLILAAYLFVGIESLLGLSWSIVWRFILTLPLGLFLGWQINRIRTGAKPNWKMLDLTSILLVGLSAYFVAIGFWTG
jgi:1,4-dihydroxy-2-naphthoate octaprenyltransferase